jgi:hypothetical protein
VRFANIDEVELNLVFVRGVEFVKAHGLITERRSRVRAEGDSDGLSPEI